MKPLAASSRGKTAQVTNNGGSENYADAMKTKRQQQGSIIDIHGRQYSCTLRGWIYGAPALWSNSDLEENRIVIPFPKTGDIHEMFEILRWATAGLDRGE